MNSIAAAKARLLLQSVTGLRVRDWDKVRFPMPILVPGVSLQADQTQNIFRMLDAGTLDILVKPRAEK